MTSNLKINVMILIGEDVDIIIYYITGGGGGVLGITFCNSSPRS